jgi:hypothetical protein
MQLEHVAKGLVEYHLLGGGEGRFPAKMPFRLIFS